MQDLALFRREGLLQDEAPFDSCRDRSHGLPVANRYRRAEFAHRPIDEPHLLVEQRPEIRRKRLRRVFMYAGVRFGRSMLVLPSALHGRHPNNQQNHQGYTQAPATSGSHTLGLVSRFSGGVRRQDLPWLMLPQGRVACRGRARQRHRTMLNGVPRYPATEHAARTFAPWQSPTSAPGAARTEAVDPDVEIAMLKSTIHTLRLRSAKERTRAIVEREHNQQMQRTLLARPVRRALLAGPILALAAASGSAAAAPHEDPDPTAGAMTVQEESEQHGDPIAGHDVHAEHANLIFGFLGNTSESSDESGATHQGFTFGVEYVRKISSRFSAGAVLERAGGDIGGTLLLAQLYYRAVGGLVFLGGVGAEFRDAHSEEPTAHGRLAASTEAGQRPGDETVTVFRLGASYEFELNRWVIAPMVAIDYVGRDNAFVLGGNFGYAF